MKKLKIYMQCQLAGKTFDPDNKRLEYCNPDYAEASWSFIESLPIGQLVEVTYQRRRNMKTPKQLAYYHAVVLPFAYNSLLEAGYEYLPELRNNDGELIIADGKIKTTERSVDWYFKLAFQFAMLKDDMLNKADMTDEEMSQFIEFIINWFRTNLDLECPPAEKNNEPDRMV